MTGTLLALIMSGSTALKASDWQGVAANAHARGDRPARDDALRRLAQVRRHHDPRVAEFTHATPPAVALTVYGEVVSQLMAQARVAPEELFAHGIQELAAAVDSPAFVAAHFPSSPAGVRPGALHRTLDRWHAARPHDPAEVRQLALELACELREKHGLRHPAAAVLELIAGACAAVDPYTHYDPAPAGQAETGGGVEIVSQDRERFEIRIARFTALTPTDLDTALESAHAVGAEQLTLDLRGNAGGSLDAAVAVCGRLLPGGVVGRTRHGELATTGTQRYHGPLVVRVDAATASGAELVAAAVQERGRARVVGDLTFGKGRVQAAPVALTRGVLVVSVTELTTPAGVAIEGRGVTPDPVNVVSNR